MVVAMVIFLLLLMAVGVGLMVMVSHFWGAWDRRLLCWAQSRTKQWWSCL